MKTLITGIDGFVGTYLKELLLKRGDEVYGTTVDPILSQNNKMIFNMNLLDKERVLEVIKEIQPEAVYHLAAQSAVGLSWENPSLTMQINVNGTIHLLEAIRDHSKDAKILIVGSSDEYGPVKENECPIDEEHPLRPVSPYGISKVTQEEVAKLFGQAYGLNIIRVRAFNHIGPGQGLNFVVPDFASKIATIERGAEPIIRVGNLEAYRDFTDVRDITEAYAMLMEKGKVGEVYNVGSGKAIKIAQILDYLISLSTEDIQIEIDASKYRKIDTPLIMCNNNKIREHIGWEVKIDIKQTLQEVLLSYRKCNSDL